MFVQQGARVALCARDAAELERARLDLKQRGGEVLAIPCDVTDRAQVEQIIQRVRDAFGAVDVLMNNAGIIQVGPIDTMTLDDFEEAINIHFWAPLYTTWAVLREMRGCVAKTLQKQTISIKAIVLSSYSKECFDKSDLRDTISSTDALDLSFPYYVHRL
jgi:NAD(P)-dependent dehydrogenase (short-subunit alcohol dehydrogenase family)